ncbi:hypothetical protein JCM18909_1304 [Cutibacterium acnes JCM 18909]|nr:hypothetical protein JCM18909_1304 [Cutibacterium acnes JCM 18909]
MQRVRKHRGIAQGTPLLGSALSVSGLARLVNPALLICSTPSSLRAKIFEP